MPPTYTDIYSVFAKTMPLDNITTYMRCNDSLVAHADVELLELPDGHLPVLVLVEGLEQLLGLLLVQHELRHEHMYGVRAFQVPHVVGDVLLKQVHDLLPGTRHK